jgi:hypothetical protein
MEMNMAASSLSQFDDLRIVSRSLMDDSKFTLCGVVRNEMYFLPAFLKHYRTLGVERFIFIDDRSDDGTLEYLLNQPDVMVLASDYRYGDQIDLPAGLAGEIAVPRILYIWRSLLHEKFTKNRWSLQVDLDEFIQLPDNMTFQDLAPALDEEGVSAVWGVMMDIYPACFQDLVASKSGTSLDLSADWYFDGQEHLQLKPGKKPRMVYPGARARLFQAYGLAKHYHQYGIGPKYSFFKRLEKTRFGTKILTFNQIYKPVLTKWQPGALFSSSHGTNLENSQRFLLPLLHFRFTGSLYRRVERALKEKSYSGGSRDYVFISMLLEKMERHNRSFLYRKSRRVGAFQVFNETLNAKGFKF